MIEHKIGSRTSNISVKTDFSYLKVVHGGWYYLTSILDDYSRYIIRLDHYYSQEELETHKAVLNDSIS